jgi:HlyD family secretion protein
LPPFKLVKQELADLNYLLERASNVRIVSVSDLQTAKYISDYQKFDTECTNADLKIARAEREMRRTQQLLADKVAASREFDQAVYEAKLSRLERELIARQTVAQWQADKVQKGFELEQLNTQARQLAEEGNLYSVNAPVDGAVLGLEGVFEGSYVQSGQRLGDISPTSDFVIDALVPPKDIGRIYKGQSVDLQIDAYPYTVWGLLPGRVVSISADSGKRFQQRFQGDRTTGPGLFKGPGGAQRLAEEGHDGHRALFCRPSEPLGASV